LEDLGLPAETLLDPFDGKRLRVKRGTAGVTVYSVGVNLADDGGDARLDICLGPTTP
jgi:hypothetical protein